MLDFPFRLPIYYITHTRYISMDVTIDSTCYIEYTGFKGPEFISNNYNLIGTDLHGLSDAHPWIAPVHHILQHPVSIENGTRWRKIEFFIVFSIFNLVRWVKMGMQ